MDSLFLPSGEIWLLVMNNLTKTSRFKDCSSFVTIVFTSTELTDTAALLCLFEYKLIAIIIVTIIIVVGSLLIIDSTCIMQSDTARMIFSWNNADPVDDDPNQVMYHETNRGASSVNLLGGQQEVPTDPTDLQSFDITVDAVSIIMSSSECAHFVHSILA